VKLIDEGERHRRVTEGGEIVLKGVNASDRQGPCGEKEGKRLDLEKRKLEEQRNERGLLGSNRGRETPLRIVQSLPGITASLTWGRNLLSRAQKGE